MRKLFVPALAALSVFSCALSAPRAQAETFTLTVSGFDINTGVTTSAVLSLTGVPDTVAGAYDLTGGSGLLTLSSTGGAASTQNLTLYLPSGTASNFQQANFGAPEFTYETGYEYNNVLYPDGTQLNGAGGTSFDPYGLLFASSTDHYNFFGQAGGYGFINDEIGGGGSSPLQTVSLVDTTATGVTPEPSSIALLGTGLLGAAGLMRRRFQA